MTPQESHAWALYLEDTPDEDHVGAWGCLGIDVQEMWVDLTTMRVYTVQYFRYRHIYTDAGEVSSVVPV